MFLSSSDTKRTLGHLFLFKIPPERTGFNMYAEYTQLQLTFLALQSYTFTSCWSTGFVYIAPRQYIISKLFSIMVSLNKFTPRISAT